MSSGDFPADALNTISRAGIFPADITIPVSPFGNSLVQGYRATCIGFPLKASYLGKALHSADSVISFPDSARIAFEILEAIRAGVVWVWERGSQF